MAARHRIWLVSVLVGYEPPPPWLCIVVEFGDGGVCGSCCDVIWFGWFAFLLVAVSVGMASGGNVSTSTCAAVASAKALALARAMVSFAMFSASVTPAPLQTAKTSAKISASVFSSATPFCAIINAQK